MGIARKCLVGTTVTLLCALPAALSASAAPTRSRVPAAVWDRLAMCESSGRWHLASGNGYYGGLQISLATWREAGGRRYASRPDLTGRIEQIAMAERILAWQGWDAWPRCSHDLGLHGTRPPKRRPPVTPPPVTPPPVTTPPVTPPPVTTPPVTPPPVTTPPVTAPPGTPPPVAVPATYTVQAGDQLVAIAHRFHLPGGWQALYARNRALIGPDPNALVLGMVLRLR